MREGDTVRFTTDYSDYQVSRVGKIETIDHARNGTYWYTKDGYMLHEEIGGASGYKKLTVTLLRGGTEATLF